MFFGALTPISSFCARVFGSWEVRLPLNFDAARRLCGLDELPNFLKLGTAIAIYVQPLSLVGK